MTQDNAPITPKESVRKQLRWGIISLAISILFIMGELLTLDIMFFNNLPPFWYNNLLLPNMNWLWLGFPISLILALIGLSNDRKKIYSIWSLLILGICIVIAVGSILFVLYFISQHGIPY